MPRKVKLDDIEEGQILAETLSNKYDQILIKKGTLLNLDSHIRVLKMWGINEISIFDDLIDASSGSVNSEEIANIETKLLNEIGWKIKNENDKLLFDVAVLSRIGKFNNE
ncbi:MAG: hypothetical protein WC121_02420 [Candidatus Kapaibacterium sp.]